MKGLKFPSFSLPFSPLGAFKPKTAVGCYNAALDLYSAGKYEKALLLLEHGLALNPQMFELHYTKGLVYDAKQEEEGAILAFQQALTVNPEDLDCLYNLARIYYNRNDIDTALGYAEMADALTEGRGDELNSYLLGVLYEQTGQLKEAAEAYQKSLAINPDQMLVGIFLGKIYIQLQDYSQAVDLLRKMADHDPNNLEVNYELSLCLAKIGEWEETIRYCKRVIEIDQTYTKGYNQLGLAYYCTDRLEEAVVSYEKALEFDPAYATAINNLAYTYEKMKNYPKAIEKFTDYLPYVQDKREEKAEIEEHIGVLRRKMAEEGHVESK